MFSSKSKLWFVLTIIVGIITSLLVTNYLQGVQAAAVEQVMTSVVVAAQKIPQGTKLTAEMVKSVQVPAKYVTPQAVTKTEDAVDQFTTVDLWPEQTIITGQLASENTAKELPYKIPQGNRAFTMAVNPLTGVASQIKPGHYVDVLLSYCLSGKPEETKALTLLQKVLVLGIGTDLQKKEEPQVGENVTIAVYPHDAQLLLYAEGIGKLKMVLRPAADDSKAKLKTVDIKYLESIRK
ncbi:MAG TPA: Flp pilus assembly protein CpaB [Bacillota bacterium]|nr:Flp pilus assembly protein CpaB [Bacillota bacterium]